MRIGSYTGWKPKQKLSKYQNAAGTLTSHSIVSDGVTTPSTMIDKSAPNTSVHRDAPNILWNESTDMFKTTK